MQITCKVPPLQERIAAQAGKRFRRINGRTTYTVTGRVTDVPVGRGGRVRSQYGHYKVELQKPDGTYVYVSVGNFYDMVAA